MMDATAPATTGLIYIADLFPDWQKAAACVGQGTASWFADDQGEPCNEGRKICAGCPVIAQCLDAALTGHEEFGIWGGAGGAERRTFARARLDRPHGPEPVVGCPCRWCADWTRHRANLDALTVGQRRFGDPGDRNGPGATHGRRSTYARGCRCDPCRWSATALGQALAADGHATADHWTDHAPDGAQWKDAKARVDDAARVVLAGSRHHRGYASVGRYRIRRNVVVMPTEPTYLTTAEVAEMFALSVDTVRRRIDDGTLAAIRIGSSVRIPRSAVDAIEAAAITKAV